MWMCDSWTAACLRNPDILMWQSWFAFETKDGIDDGDYRPQREREISVISGILTNKQAPVSRQFM